MPYYTNRQGVIPNRQIDDQPGWILVPDPPQYIPEGQELIWLNWEWVVRDMKPEPIEGYVWKFIFSEYKSNANSNGWNSFMIVSSHVSHDSNVSANSNVIIQVE